MKRLRIIVALAAIVASAWVSHADEAELDFIFEHYSSDDGLSHNSVSDIHQDRKGYLWVSTWYGLSRFDGNKFVSYIMLPGDFTNLSHNRILSMEEDANGYLWLTAYDYSLYRFDTETESFVAIPDELEGFSGMNQKVSVFHCDKVGNTWIGLPGHGLMRIAPDLSVHRISGATGANVKTIYEDEQSDIYAVSETGVCVVRDDSAVLLTRTSDIIGFNEFGGKIYIASSDAILVFDKESGISGKIAVVKSDAGAITSITSTGKDDCAGLYVGFRNNAIAKVDTTLMSVTMLPHDMGRVRYLFPDSKGLLWIATDRTGIYSWNPHSERFKHYEHPRNVMSYYSDSLARVVEHDGVSWIKMNNYGFGYYDREKDEIKPLYNVKEQEDCRFMNGVACFEVDRSGVLWFSTVQRGLDRVTVIPPKVQVIVPPTSSDDELSSAEVRAMYRDRSDNIWVATKSRELYRYSPDMSSCERFTSNGYPDIGVVYAVFEDDEGNIWLGTKGDGLVRMTRSGDRWSMRRFKHDPSVHNSLSSDNIYSIAQDADGRIWIGTFGGGLSMLPTPNAEEFYNVYNDFPDYPLEYGDRVRYVHRMPDGKMLVATVGGLIWFTPSENIGSTVFNFIRKVSGETNSIGSNDIIYMFSDRSGSTWLCTFGGGLNRLYFDGVNPQFDIVSTADGLASNIIFSAVDDKNGNIWLATERGLSRVDADASSVINYTRYDGVMPATFSEATCTSLADGSMLFGTHNHIYRIDPEAFRSEPQECRLVISGLSIDSERVPVSQRVVIPHDYSFIRIDFASLNFKTGGALNYSYKMDGYDKNWISASSSHSVTYSRIPPGRYEFLVTASSADGSYKSETANVQIRIRPSLWLSLPAKILYVVAVLLFLAVLVRMFLTSVRLRNDVKLEKDLNDVKVRFFTNISHELRTPLTLILGGIDEISRNTPEGDRNEYSVNLVYKNAKRMMTLVNQLLDIRRIVNGKIRLKVSQFDIVELLKKVYDDFRDMASERQIELSLTHSVDSLMVWGDAMRIEALIYNLLSNAFKYTADGGRVEAAIFYRDGDSEFKIMVKDNGIGVPKDKQTAIFEPFVQAADSSFKGMSSSGIGLSFCKEIADIHGGTIWVTSEKNKGSEFYVKIPIDRDHFSEETAEFIEQDSKVSSKDAAFGLSKYKVKPTYPSGALKVLVVEDNAELKVYIYNNLINKYEVRDASNGKEALQVIASGWVPDMIVTDLMMPQMDGIELINNIRNDFSTSHIPIIMITAKHENDTHIKAMKYGADGYIAKPFTMELLSVRIENLLERRKSIVSVMAAEQPSDVKGRRKINIAPEEVVITDRDEELIKKVMKWLEDNVADAEITVDQLATHVGMGRTSMYNKIKGLTGKSPVELIQDFRLEKATYYLKSGQFSVSETSYKVGFSDPGYFSRSFKKHFGISPADYIKENYKKNE